MWNNLEHQIWNKIKKYALEQKTFLCAVSGGLDSMALLQVLLRLNRNNNIKVLHYHHGSAPDDPIQNQYRDKTFSLVQKFCEKNHLKFFSEKSSRTLSSEAEMRNARLQFFGKYKTTDTVLLTAHHEDDVFETRLLKMIRGTGSEGLSAFSEYNGEVFRPFYEIKKAQLMDYVSELNLKEGHDWLEDPSNKNDFYLRNWLRNNWLMALEVKSPGSVSNFARSLDRLLTSVKPETDISQKQDFEPFYVIQDKSVSIDRVYFATLSTKDQLSFLVMALKKIKISDFSLMQLKEILKRLDKNQNDYIFSMLSAKWVINAQQIVIEL